MEYTRDMFVKDNFDKNITYGWDILAISSIYKKEYKADEAEKEIILGYANALNCITDSLLKQNHPAGTIMTFRTNSLAIPFIFLARHTVELSLKYICRLLSIDTQHTHKLMPLWNIIIECFEKNTSIQRKDLKKIETFISVIEELDCDGSHARYSKGIRGNLYNDKPKFIHTEQINKFIQSTFIKLVNSIEKDKVDK